MSNKRVSAPAPAVSQTSDYYVFELPCRGGAETDNARFLVDTSVVDCDIDQCNLVWIPYGTTYEGAPDDQLDGHLPALFSFCRSMCTVHFKQCAVQSRTEMVMVRAPKPDPNFLPVEDLPTQPLEDENQQAPPSPGFRVSTPKRSQPAPPVCPRAPKKSALASYRIDFTDSGAAKKKGEADAPSIVTPRPLVLEASPAVASSVTDSTAPEGTKENPISVN